MRWVLATDDRPKQLGIGGVTPAFFLALILLYFGLQSLIRPFISNSAALDEAEQLLFSQRWQWGYGPQPPLYTWLQIGVFQLLGVNIFGLSLLKNSLLFGMVAFLYFAARRVLNDPSRALTATLWLCFMPQVVWECQRDLTHTVMVTCTVTATWWLTFGLRDKPTLARYVALGLLVATGILSNYSYLVFWIGLLIAMACDNSWRQSVFRWEMALALGIGLALTTPHLLWAWHHPQVVFGTMRKLQVIQSDPWVWTVLKGMGYFAWAFLPTWALLAVIVFALTNGFQKPNCGESANPPDRACVRLVGKMLLVVLGEIILAIIIFRASNFRERWFTPLLVILPVGYAALAWRWLTPPTQRRSAILAAGVAIFIGVLLPTRVWLAKALDRPGPLNSPFAELAPQLKPWLRDSQGVITENAWLGGNLRLVLAGVFVATPKEPGLDFNTQDAELLFIWDATRKEELPHSLSDYARQSGFTVSSSNSPAYVQVPLKYHWNRSMRLGLIRARGNPAALKVPLASLPDDAVEQKPASPHSGKTNKFAQILDLK